MIGGVLKVVVVVLLFAVLIICRDPHVRGPSESDLVLGDTTYEYTEVSAPVAVGPGLQLFSWLLTETPFGSFIRRFLLNNNGITKLRELSSQTKGVQPLTTPILRLSDALRDAHENEAGRALAADLSTDAVLKGGFPGQESGSRIEAYYAAFQSGKLDPVEAIQRVLKATRKVQGVYVPFADIHEETVLAQAEASRARWNSASGPLSVLDGVPIAVKDMIDVAGHLTSDGSASNFANTKATSDDPIVARLRELGAIVLATTVMTEGGVTPLGFSVAFQGPFNPFNASHYSGGSSSGSAVAVVLGLVPLAVGFDGGGSIRIPASFSGAVGLAASYGRIPFTSTRAISNVKAGPIGATVGDVAIGFAAMVGEAPEFKNRFFSRMYDGDSQRGLPTAHLGGFDAGLKNVRIGIFYAHFDDMETGSPVLAACKAALAKLEAAGAVLVPITIPNIGWLRLAHAIKISTEFASGWDVKYSTGVDLEPNTRITVGLGTSVTAVEALACDKLRAWAFEYINDLFAEEQLTAIVSPTVPVSAPKIPEGATAFGESNTKLVVQMMKYIFLANFVGSPGISVPIGTDTSNENMPIGLHFMGAHWREHDLLRLARATENILEPLPRPADYVDVLATK